MATFTGSYLPDKYSGTELTDSIDGLEGNDTLRGRGGNDAKGMRFCDLLAAAQRSRLRYQLSYYSPYLHQL